MPEKLRITCSSGRFAESDPIPVVENSISQKNNIANKNRNNRISLSGKLSDNVLTSALISDISIKLPMKVAMPMAGWSRRSDRVVTTETMQ